MESIAISFEINDIYNKICVQVALIFIKLLLYIK